MKHLTEMKVKSAWKSVALFLFTLVLLSCKPIGEFVDSIKNKEVQELVTRAGINIDEDFGEGTLDREAGELLEQAIAKNPNYAPAYVELARLTLSRGHMVAEKFQEGTVEKSFDYLEKAVALDPNYSQSYVLLGHVHRLAGRTSEAIQSLEKAEKLGSKSAWIQNNHGEIWARWGQYAKARSYFFRAFRSGIGQTANERNAYISAATRLQELAALERNSDMVKRYGKMATAAAQPKNAWVWNNVAINYIIDGEFELAEECLRQALEIMDFGAARTNLSLALYGKWAKAIKSVGPDAAEAYFAEAFELNSNWEKYAGTFLLSGNTEMKVIHDEIAARFSEIRAKENLAH